MSIENLTDDERQQIATEEYKKLDCMVLLQAALVMGAKMAINVNSAETTLTTKATFDEKRYDCKMLITWEETESYSLDDDVEIREYNN